MLVEISLAYLVCEKVPAPVEKGKPCDLVPGRSHCCLGLAQI